MEHLVRVGLGQRERRNNMIKLTVVATVAVVGILMAVISVIKGAYLFALLYLLAAVLGVMYAIIKINAVLPPFAASDGKRLYLNTWDNNFFPFNIDFRPAFFADFVPAKTLSYEIPLSEITDMAVGTKGYLLRVLNDEKFAERMADISRRNRRIDGLMKRCDILYVKVRSGEIYMMSVSDFDINGLYRLVDTVEHSTRGLSFKTNLRKLRKKRETILGG